MPFFLASSNSSVVAGSRAKATCVAELVAGLLDGLGEDFQGLVAALEVGGEAALVADGGAQVAVVQHLLEAVEHLGAHAQRLAERWRRRAA